MALDTTLGQSQFTGGGQYGLGMFVPHSRSIGGIVADVWIEEDERDEVSVTEHPVEQGAPISDHAFKRAEEVTIRAGWSIQKTGDLSAETGMYGIMLNWQKSFVLFDLYTGKRAHKNMLISSIASVTDKESEYSLMLVLICREVILTKTSTGQPATSTNPGDHADASNTGPTLTTGLQPLNQTSSSQLDVTAGLNMSPDLATSKGITF